VAGTKLKLSGRYVGVLGCALVLYTVSCAPGALWQDSGLSQYRIWHNDIEGFSGLAISHPLFYILAIGAKYIPVGEFAHRVNIVCAIAAAVAVANVFLLVHLWLGKDFPAIVAALTLGVSHTFWAHASIIETYTLWAALFSAELIMLLQYAKTRRVSYLYWLALLNGLAIAVHMLACIPLACYAVFLTVLLAKREIRTRDLLAAVLLWIVGALPYEYLIIKNIMQTGDVAGVLASAAFGVRWQGAVLNTSLSGGIAKGSFLFILFNFPTPNILLLFVGCFGLFRILPGPSFRNVLAGLVVLFFVFAFRYTVPDRYGFFIPFYCVASILTGAGAYVAVRHINRKAFSYLILFFSLLPVPVYAYAPSLAAKMQLDLGTRGDIPYRDDYKYFLQPWKTGYDGAERFAQQALEAVENNAVIYADSTTVAPLLYVQEVKGARPDVKIVSGTAKSKDAPRFDKTTIERLLQDGPIYVVSPKPGYCPAFVLDNYELVQAGLLWRVVGRETCGKTAM
jgi:hypothetical protein